MDKNKKLTETSIPSWITQTIDSERAKSSPAHQSYDDYSGGKIDLEKGAKRKVSNTVAELLKTKGAVTKVVGRQVPDPKGPPAAGALKDAPDWLLPKKPEMANKQLDIKGVPPVLARQLAVWHKLTGSQKTKLEREFKVRGLSQPHLYLEDSYYGSYNVSIEKKGAVWAYMIESEDGILARGISATEKNAINTVNKKIEEIDEQAKHEVEGVVEAVDYIKKFSALKSL